ncbi:MAG: CoA-binding protein [Kofleriaceae bacterium]
MAHANPPDDAIRTLLASASSIAVVGASNNPAKPSREIVSRLLAHGYRVVPVNPNETEVLGLPSFPSLAAATAANAGPFDIVDVFRRAEDTPTVAADAIAAGGRALWLQSGIVNEAAAAAARAAGLAVVMDLCISVELSLLAVPKKHGRAPTAPSHG